MSPNPIVYWEIASHDADETVQFLRDVFDWEPEWDQQVGLYEFPTPEGDRMAGGGVFTLRKAKMPFLTLYIRVEDIEAKAAQVVAHGGFLIEPPFDIGGGTQICPFNEPSGVTLAMIQSAPRETQA